MKRSILSMLIVAGFTFIGVGSFALDNHGKAGLIEKVEKESKASAESVYDNPGEKHPEGIQENESETTTKDREASNGAEIAEKEEYVVKKGDTLAEIAEEFLGSQEKWTVIAKANDIENPDKIYVGQHLTIPSAEENKSNEPKEEKAPGMGGDVESAPENNR